MSGGSANDQMDQLQQMREASRRIRDDAQRTSDALSSQINQMRQMVQNSGNLQSDQYVDWRRRMKLQTKAMKQYYRQNRKNLTAEDKLAFKVMYKNRRRDLRDLEREARYRFRDIEEEGVDAFENIGNKISSISESLRDWATALNVDAIVNGLDNANQSIYESKKQLQKTTGLTKSQMHELSDSYRQSSKDSGYAISAGEYMETATKLAEMGYKDIEFLKDFGTSITNLSAVVAGVDVSNLEKFTEFADKYGTDQAVLYEQLAVAVNNSQDLYSSGADMMNQFEANYSDILYRSGGDLDKFNAMMRSRMESYSILNDNWLGNQAESINELFGRLNDLTDTDAIQTLQALAGTNANNIRQSAMSGDYAQATKDLILAIKSNYSNGNADTMASALGIDKTQMQDIVGQMYSVTAESLEENSQNFKKALETSLTSNPLEQALKEAYISPIEKLQNWLADTKLGSMVDEFMSSTGMSLTDVAVVGNVLGKGISGIGKLLGKFGLGGGGAAGAGAGGLGGAGGAGGALSAIGNFFSAGFGGAGANTAAGAAGMNILGFGAEGGMATLGTGGAMSAGLLTTAATGIAGAAMTIKDAIGGVKKSEEWLGKNTVGAKVASGIGGAIGGTGTGIGEEGATVGSVAKNVGGNALKGAAIGATIGSVVPGLGTAIGAAIGGGVGAVAGAIGGSRIAKAIDWVGEKSKQMWEGVKEVASKAWEGIKGWGSKAWEGIKSTASNLWSSAKEKASDLWNNAKNFGIDAFNTAVGVGDMAMEGLFNAVGLDWDDTKQKISEGWDNIKETAKEKWTAVKDWASEKWDDISTKASEIWDNVSTKASEIWGGIKDKAGEIWGGIKDVASEAWEGIKETAKEKLSAVGDFFSGIWGGITDAVGKAKDWVSDKVDGIKEKAKGAVDKVKDVASGAWNKVTSFFGGAKKRGEDITGISGSHASGLSKVPYDGYIAELHKGEAVLTTGQADAWRKGIDTVKSAGSAVMDKVNAAKGAVRDKITQMGGGGLLEKFDTIKSKIQDTLKGKFDEAKSSVTGMFEGESENKMVNFTNNIKDRLVEAIGKFKENSTKQLDKMKETGSEIYDIWKDDSTSVWDKTKQTASKVFDTLKTNGTNIFTNMNNSISKVFGNNTLMGKVVDKLGSVADTVKSGTLGSFFSNLGQGLFGGTQIDGSHKDGLDYVPKDGYIAELHKGEAVLNRADASDYRSSSVKSWFSNLMKTIAPTLQAPTIASPSANGGSTDYGDTASAYSATGMSGDKQEFINKISPGAKKGYQLYKVLPSLTLAQGALESGWGKHAIGNNLFGIKAGSSWTGKKQLVWTHEVENGVRKKVQAWFRDYDSIDDSVADHAKLLAGDRYAAVRAAKGYREAANAVQSAGYATDPNYAKSLIGLIESNGFAQFDKEVGAYKQGTPWVPNDQVAILHKGEAVIPAEANPANLTKSDTQATPVSDESTSSDAKDIVNAIKWMVNRLEKKLDETSTNGGTTENTYNYGNSDPRTRKSDAVFSF